MPKFSMSHKVALVIDSAFTIVAGVAILLFNLAMWGFISRNILILISLEVMIGYCTLRLFTAIIGKSMQGRASLGVTAIGATQLYYMAANVLNLYTGYRRAPINVDNQEFAPFLDPSYGIVWVYLMAGSLAVAFLLVKARSVCKYEASKNRATAEAKPQ